MTASLQANLRSYSMEIKPEPPSDGSKLDFSKAEKRENRTPTKEILA